MPFVYKLHVSESQHLQEQCQEHGALGYNSPLLHYALTLLTQKRSLCPRGALEEHRLIGLFVVMGRFIYAV